MADARSQLQRPAAGTAAPRTVRPGSLAAWLVAMRPRSLLVAVSPVLVGAALGFERTGALDPVATLLVLVAAVLVQAISNMQNDAGYTLRGGERSGTRTGLPRATANGWLSVRSVRRAIVVAALLATAIGVALVGYRGWPVLLIGIVSLAGALAYMGGPVPIAYTPLGELTVFVYFGLVAVLGTDWVLTGSVGPATIVAAIALGCLAAAALCVNNHRDIAHDRLVGRRTFAVVFGPAGSAWLYRALLGVAFALVPVVAALADGGSLLASTARASAACLLLPFVLAPVAFRLARDFLRCPPGIAFNAILFRTFRLELAFALLLAIGAIVARVVR